jgi:endonuclease-3 related protein
MENREPVREQSVGSLLVAIHDALLAYYGPQSWWPTRTGSAWEIMLGAVLTQRTTWTNVELSLRNMVERWGTESLRDPRIVLETSDEELAAVLRPTGFFASKIKTLKNLAGYVVNEGGVEALVTSTESTEEMRKELLGLWGIGPETADAILLYALGRPSFVADAYALRLASRWGLVRPNAGYDEVRALFMDNLPRDSALFNGYHALIVQHGKNRCRPKPLCHVCPLSSPISVDETSERRYEWHCSRLGVA